MIDLKELSEKEINSIAIALPLNMFITYCQHNVRLFNEIMKGIRPKSLKEDQKQKLIIQEVKKGKSFVFNGVVSFLENVSKQFNDDYIKSQEEGISKEQSLYMALGSNMLSNDIKLLIKVVGDIPDCDFIDVLQIGINNQKNLEMDINKDEKDIEPNTELTSVQKELKDANKRIRTLESNLTTIKSKLSEKDVEIDELKEQNENNKKQLCDNDLLIKDKDKELKDANKRIKKVESLEKSLETFTNDNKSLSNNIKNLEKSLNAKDEKIETLNNLIQQKDSEILELGTQIKKVNTTINMRGNIPVVDNNEIVRPNDMKSCFENIEDILYDLDFGDESGKLSQFLSKILYIGKPIVGDNYTINIIEKILNCLYRNDCKIITFYDGINDEFISNQLSDSCRVVFLNNFIGNYPETYLLPIFNQYKNKIIIMNMAYNKMMKYISEDFLQYATYINLDRFNVNINNDIEDVEVLNESKFKYSKNKINKTFKKILEDLEFGVRVINEKCTLVDNNNDIECMLAFEIIPYCIDVLDMDVFDLSEQINGLGSKLINTLYK